MHATRTLLALLLALTLASCIDYREELWIQANGSGRIDATITIESPLGQPTDGGTGTEPDAVEKELRELFEATEGVELEYFQPFTEGNRRGWTFRAAFRDIRQLKPALASAQGEIGAIFGDFEIVRLPDSRLSIERTVHLSPPAESATAADGNAAPTGNESQSPDLAAALGKSFGNLMADALLSKHHLTYITHFPTEVIGANSSTIDRAANTVTWRIPLSQAVKGPVAMTAEIRRPGGWMLWVFGGFLLLVTAAIAIPAWRKRRQPPVGTPPA